MPDLPLCLADIPLDTLTRDLLGDRNDRLSSANDWRWRGKGSFSFNPDKLAFTDHETGESGGLLDMVAILESLPGRAAAVKWLQQHQYLPEPAGSTHERSPRQAPKPRPAPPAFKPIGTNTTPTQSYALEIWAKSENFPAEIWGHPYGQAKKLPPWGYDARVYFGWDGAPNGNAIIVPMKSFPGLAICGVQVICGNQIDGKWQKRNYGPRGILPLRDFSAGPIWVVEGYLDGVALAEDRSDCCPVVAFGKVKPVMENLQRHFGARPVYGLQDNDQ